MHQIKIIVISLYIIILGFIIFGNASVFADEVHSKEQFVFTTSSGFDDYWVNSADKFDLALTTNGRSGFTYSYNLLRSILSFDSGYNYFSLPSNNVASFFPGISLGQGEDPRGYVVFVYTGYNNLVSSNSDFTYATLNDYYGGYYDNNTNFDNSLSFPAVKVNCFSMFAIYNFGQSYISRKDGSGGYYNQYIPLSILNYSHKIFYDKISNSNGASQITSAINNQTNTLSNAIANQTQATKEQTNALLDTNETGNETMSVNDTTTDTSADLSNLFNQLENAFTDDSPQYPKFFNLKLPNGDTHTFILDANILTNFLDNSPVLKAFYQAFFYVVFGGYVIFDFKKIINKLKEGNIDNVVGSSSPVDSVVNMSLK